MSDAIAVASGAFLVGLWIGVIIGMEASRPQERKHPEKERTK